MSGLQDMFASIDREINELDGWMKAANDNITARRKNIEKLEKMHNENIMKKAILTEACKTIREISSDTFAKICTRAVRDILNDDLEVRIVHGERNGVPTADFKIKSTYEGYETELEPTDEESGGGVADIVSLANFITMNMINGQTNTAPIVLDEPTKFVSAGNADRVGHFVSDASKKFKKQIIMVTHAQETTNYADRVFKVSLDDTGVSEAVVVQ